MYMYCSLQDFEHFDSLIQEAAAKFDSNRAPDGTCSSHKAPSARPPNSASFSLPKSGSFDIKEITAQLDKMREMVEEQREWR